MKVISSCFTRKKGIGKYKDVNYDKLKSVFINSAKDNFPHIETIVYDMKPPKPKTWRHDLAYASLEVSRNVLKEKELIAVCDIDVMFINDISDIEEKNFDIAITVRDWKHPLNSGVWFYRPNERSRSFVEAWIKNKLKIMKNVNKHQKKIDKYAGINQASLQMTIDELKNDVNILELPCPIWNATQTEWKKITNETKIIHIKSELRKFCLGLWKMKKGYEYLTPLINKFKGYLK